MVEIPKTKTTFADYTALPESNQIIELSDGEIVVNPPLDQHQQVLHGLYNRVLSLEQLHLLFLQHIALIPYPRWLNYLPFVDGFQVVRV